MTHRWYRWIALLCIVSIALGASSHSLVQARVAEPQIVGGTAAAPGQFPWIVSLVDPRFNEPFCGGSLITPEWVVTAAHCLHNQNDVTTQPMHPETFQVIAGSLHPVEPTTGQALAVAQVVIHPDYTYNQDIHDIGLLRLAPPADLQNPNIGTIGPISLEAESLFAAPGAQAIVSGWGSTDPIGDTFPESLLYTNIPIVASDSCDYDNIADADEVFDTQICAGGVPGQDSCLGDSGGPLVVTTDQGVQLVGITSFGHELCAVGGKHGVYTRVSRYADWVNQYLIQPQPTPQPAPQPEPQPQPQPQPAPPITEPKPRLPIPLP